MNLSPASHSSLLYLFCVSLYTNEALKEPINYVRTCELNTFIFRPSLPSFHGRLYLFLSIRSAPNTAPMATPLHPPISNPAAHVKDGSERTSDEKALDAGHLESQPPHLAGLPPDPDADLTAEEKAAVVSFTNFPSPLTAC